jgi:hypothetical protein
MKGCQFVVLMRAVTLFEMVQICKEIISCDWAPGAFEPRGCPREGVFRIVVLVESLFDVVGLAAVIAPAGLALQDVDPKAHKKSPCTVGTAGRYLLAPRA